MICSEFSIFFEKCFATEETADESSIFIYIIASMCSIFLDRKHNFILALENTNRESDVLA